MSREQANGSRAISTPAVVARRLGEPGYVRFVKRLAELGVLDREERRGWIALHGAVLRATEPPLDDGTGPDEQALTALVAERGAIEEAGAK